MRTLVRRLAAAVAPLATAAGLLAPAQASAPPAPSPAPETRLHLVTLRDGAPTDADRLLERVGADGPVYRWRHALRGFAADLSPAQARLLDADASVALVEPDTRRRTAAAAPGVGGAGSPYTTGRGGRGTVIGVVDTGLAPESPLFTWTRGLGPRPRGFDGRCRADGDWPGSACNGKVVAAHWFVRGFGRANLRSGTSLSPRDDSGHGTQVASLAAGNARVSIDLGSGPAGTYTGVAPQARLAIYKACWSAPDPADDGCSTADLVSAVDRAVADGVDVLNLSVAGPQHLDTLQRALLGAARADVVVVGAAGNDADRAYAAHPAPWVTTVGGSQGVQRRGRVALAGGPELEGAMLGRTAPVRARLLPAAEATAPGARRADARLCRPGSLDARRARGAIVVCARGGLGRVDKSTAVERADGIGMVLLNEADGRRGVAPDLHAVPTVHLAAPEARRLRRWLADHPRGRAALVGLRARAAAPGLPAWTPSGDPQGGVLKPDVVAPAGGLLGAVPAGAHPARWNVLSGTSAAAAQVSGLAARLRARHPRWSAAAVRSVLATATDPVSGPVLRSGSGRASGADPGLVFEVSARQYRRYLDGELGSSRLNTPSVLVGGDHRPVARTVTNRSGVRRTWRATVEGFERHAVTVDPPARTLAPGASATFTIRSGAAEHAHRTDDGHVVWRSRGVAPVRVPVVLGR